VARVVCGTARAPHDLGAVRARAHPQYVGFILILAGFCCGGRLLTAMMFPVLVAMYVRLARREDRESDARFGDAYRSYAAVTPAFIPNLWRERHGSAA
jgi:protein-S-isoprenylcysteine O-methyltransferase Ste14